MDMLVEAPGPSVDVTPADKQFDRDVLELLEDARDVLMTMGWATCHLATDDYNRRVAANSPEATNVCAVGAIARANDLAEWAPGPDPITRRAVAELAHALPHPRDYSLVPVHQVTEFNDGVAEHKVEVIAVFDRAIHNLRERIDS